MAYRMTVDDREMAFEILDRRPQLRIGTGVVVHTIAESPGAEGAFEIALDGRIVRGWRYAAGDRVYLRIEGRNFVVGLIDARSLPEGHGKLDDEVRANMPGTLVAIHVESGQSVGPGDRLVTIESMKLQITLVAPRRGVVERIHVPPETAFERGALLVSLAPSPVERDAVSKTPGAS